MSAPRKNSSENGMRNFTDASIQIQWRTAALFGRNASVIDQTAPQNSVDCQRWSISAPIICPCPWRRVLRGMRAQQLLRFFDVFARDLAHLHQVRHDRV